MMIIDTHVHIFPEKIAASAVSALERQYEIESCGSATVPGIISSMKKAKVDGSVLLSIATRPGQVESINNWISDTSKTNPNLIPLGAMHPDHPDPETEIIRMRKLGIKGIKLHSEFQHFYPDEERMFRLYEALSSDMVVVFHAGDEIRPLTKIHTRPKGLASVVDSFPELKIVAAHLGCHRCWNEVEQYLIGKKIFFDTAYVFPVPGYEHLTTRRITDIIEAHGFDKILFGTDYPFRDQSKEVDNILKLDIDEVHKKMILGSNAVKLFNIKNNTGSSEVITD